MSEDKKLRRHITVYANDITPIEFCGKQVAWQISSDGAFEPPFEIEPTEGEHNFEICDGCKKTEETIYKRLTSKFEGKEGNKGFPFCCPYHANLNNLQEFNRSSYIGVPKMVAQKIIFTNQHIINNQKSDDWYESTTDYIDWVIESFGDMPNDCGEPLFLSDYFFYVCDLLKNNTGISEERKERILVYVNIYRTVDTAAKIDLNVILNTYQKWFKIFPFDLNSYFGNLKEHFENTFPLLNGTPEINRFSGRAKIKFQNKESLVEELLKLTNDLMVQINGNSLYDNGLITDTNKISLELLINSRKLRLQEGYINSSEDEEKRYRKILKEWFKDEKAFFDTLTLLLKKAPLDREDFNNWLFGKPAWREEAYRLNTGKAYQHKQDLLALFWNNYIYYQQKFEGYYKEFEVIPLAIFNNLIFEFRQSFPKNGRLEGINYFDDLVEQLIEKYSNPNNILSHPVSTVPEAQTVAENSGGNTIKKAGSTARITIKEEAILPLFKVLKDFFKPEDQPELEKLLRSGFNVNNRLLFKAGGNRLTDTFKRLYEFNFITGCQKKDLQYWIVANFDYLHNNEQKPFKFDTIEKTISRNHYPCKNPLIEIVKGQIQEIQQPRKKKYNKY